MNRISATIAALIILVLFCSCVTGTDITKKNRDGSPVWTKEIPTSNRLIYGVGKSRLSVESNSQKAADAEARNNLALQINVNIKDALMLYSSEKSTVVTDAFETIIIQSVNLSMKRVVVEQRWTADDGTVWSLVSFRIKDLPDLYRDAANDYLNQLEEKKIATQQKLISLLEELKESNDEGTLELKRLAQEKAAGIISEAEEISRSIDVASQTNQISEYLIENGYELD